jgi:hypothetical protein
VPRPRSPNPSPAALRMRALRARRAGAVGVLERSRSVPPAERSTNVRPIEQTHAQTNVLEESEPIFGPRPSRHLPPPPEFLQEPIGQPSSVGVQPFTERLRDPGFRGYPCPHSGCSRGPFLEREAFQRHQIRSHGFKWEGSELVPTQRTLAERLARPLPERSAPRYEPRWERVPDWERVEPKKPTFEELKADGWEAEPRKPTKRELVGQGWLPVKASDLEADGWEPVG